MGKTGHVWPQVTASRREKTYGLYLGALASYAPVAWLASNVVNQPEYGSVALITLSSIAATLGLFRLLRWRLVPERSFALATAATVCVWNWDSLQAPVGDLPSAATSSLLVLLIIVATWVNAGSRYFELFVGISAATLLVISGGLLVYRYTSIKLEASVVTVDVVPLLDPPSSAAALPPDIHIVVLDGYARSDVLDSVFGFDNHGLESELEAKGFQISDRATANYSVTHFSIASLLQSNYVAGPEAMIGPADLMPLRDVMSGRNSTVETLRQFRYSFVHGDSVWWGTRCGMLTDYCLKGAATNETAWKLLRGTAASPILSSQSPGIELSRERIDQFSDWNATTSQWPAGPIFSFFHIPLPHPPYLLDADCEYHADTDRHDDLDLLQARSLYVKQLECANELISALTTQVDSEAIVVIMSDHGPDTGRIMMEDHDDWEMALFERMSILLTVRLPSQCAEQPVPEDLVTVNVMRVVMNCALDGDLPMLEARHFLAPSTSERRHLTEIVDPDLGPTGSSLADRFP